MQHPLSLPRSIKLSLLIYHTPLIILLPGMKQDQRQFTTVKPFHPLLPDTHCAHCLRLFPPLPFMSAIKENPELHNTTTFMNCYCAIFHCASVVLKKNKTKAISPFRALRFLKIAVACVTSDDCSTIREIKEVKSLELWLKRVYF